MPPAPQAVRDAYARDETDEFVKPVAVGEEARIRPGDSVVAFNFRPDRMRELTLRSPRGFGESTAAARKRRALHDDDRVRRGLDLSGLVPACAPEVTFPQVIAHMAAASCTLRRPRSTHTSPTSSAAARSTPER